MMKKLAAYLLAGVMALTMGAGLAEETTYDIEFDGSVVSGVSRSVISDVGGSVESVYVRAGQLVKAGDVMATLRTDKVYASEAGTVAAVFGGVGDSVSEISGRYGAVMYIEPDSGKYTISADTEKAYASSDNLYIHVGEKVYLKCTDGDHTGAGFVASVSGSDYTVEVTGGKFELGENVNVFRGEGYGSKTRIGRGECQRGTDIAVGGSSTSSSAAGSMGGGSDAGSIVAMHVSAGDVVTKGQLLYETLSGEYAAYYCTGADIVCDADGILGEMNLSVGGSVTAGGSVATVYPVGDMQIEIQVNEMDLPFIHESDSVIIRFNWDEGEKVYTGSVFAISHMAGSAAQSSGASAGMGDMMGGSTSTGSASAEAEYTAIIAFTPDADVRIGMTATVTVTAE